ncbi:carotenoid biosynthesis protein [Amycolatopsis mediterranei]|uniref:carotenoid biosynthesis protein n=1 Tax=Amycolatopsis mediterranei TaxID=33910 RepID=UPI00343D2BBC
MVSRTAAFTRRHPAPPALTAWLCAAATVLCQILYSVTDPGGRTPLTVLTVLCFAAASLADAWSRCGGRAAVTLVLIAGGGGLLAEVTGLHTGVPFGRYEYTGLLGWPIAGVPGIVPLAWLMMAWPALLAGRALAVKPAGVVAVAAGALAAWDVFLDPQMVDEGYWIWSSPEPSLPLVAGIPVTNFAGWLLVAVLIQAALHRWVPRPPDPIPGPAAGPAPALYLWTWFSSVWAHFAFFGRPWVAVAGGVLMGAVAVPFAIRLGRGFRWARVSA